MGLDVHIFTDSNEEVWNDDISDFLVKYNLSRTFCIFMQREYVVSEDEIPELDQIGEITGVDISSIYDMNTQNVEIDKVLHTLDCLIKELSKIKNLPELLDSTDFDTLDVKWYFENFNVNTGNGYIGNNFGQDLRNFRHFLEYAKARGTKTVYFYY